MVDPVTVGSILVAGALSMAAEALVKGAVGAAVKDGYKALKEKVSHWASGEVANWKRHRTLPRDKPSAEIIDAQPVDDLKSLRVLAEALVAKLKKTLRLLALT